jgi:hypothetical protein
MSDNEDYYNDGRDPETISAIDRQLKAMGAGKIKKHKKHKHHKHEDTYD